MSISRAKALNGTKPNVMLHLGRMKIIRRSESQTHTRTAILVVNPHDLVLEFLRHFHF